MILGGQKGKVVLHFHYNLAMVSTQVRRVQTAVHEGKDYRLEAVSPEMPHSRVEGKASATPQATAIDENGRSCSSFSSSPRQNADERSSSNGNISAAQDAGQYRSSSPTQNGDERISSTGSSSATQNADQECIIRSSSTASGGATLQTQDFKPSLQRRRLAEETLYSCAIPELPRTASLRASPRASVNSVGVIVVVVLLS